MRANIAQRDNWAQIRIGACALLLPPLTLGAAFYSMLATPDEGAARLHSTAAKAHVVDTTQAWAVSTDTQPVAQATQPVAGKPAPPEGPATGARQALVAGSAENTARVSDPVPVRVTVRPSPRANPPAPAHMDSAPTGSLDAAPSQSVPAEVSTA